MRTCAVLGELILLHPPSPCPPPPGPPRRGLHRVPGPLHGGGARLVRGALGRVRRRRPVPVRGQGARLEPVRPAHRLPRLRLPAPPLDGVRDARLEGRGAPQRRAEHGEHGRRARVLGALGLCPFLVDPAALATDWLQRHLDADKSSPVAALSAQDSRFQTQVGPRREAHAVRALRAPVATSARVRRRAGRAGRQVRQDAARARVRPR